jgi:hypothetical protein
MPQGRGLERAFVRFFLRHTVPTEVRLLGSHAHAQVMKALVNEVEAGMTGDAAGFALEEGEASLGRRRQRALIASEEAVVGRVPRQNRALVRRDGLRDTLGIEVGAEDSSKLLLIGWNGPQILDQELRALVRGLKGLIFERGARSSPLLRIKRAVSRALTA